MRAFFTNSDGRTADLCQMLYSDETRLTIHGDGSTLSRDYYRSWTDAVTALASAGGNWTNDMTGDIINKKWRNNTMTIRELAMNLIEHADTTPDVIDTDRATEIISWLDPDAGLPEDLTPEALTAAWNSIIRDSMRRISIDNGAHWMDPDDVIALLDNPDKARWCGTWESITAMMDDDTRDRVNAELAPCSNAAFLRRYLELAPCDLIIG